ncbi:MAG: neuraminidase-like domain-containing protein [Byssovorax sp.]
MARPLRDRVRRAHRTALVDYLLGSGYVASADDLYAWLLVDVEMEPVMLTSRIKQAIGSVQTFVQRALMNMEPHVKLDEDQAKRWVWMKNYRVWEADRKVFLYPENWIEPALRDDKTTFFKQLESDLRRQDLTDENVEQAYVRYLEKLADVSSLEIAAMHHEVPEGDAGCDAVDVLHLVGRTVSQPKRYFYCAGRRPAGSTRARRWSPWDPIDLEIESDHLLLSMYHRRLHLFWASIEEKPDSKQNTPKNGKNGDPLSDGDEGSHTHLEIRLRWSERAQDRWTAPRSSSDSLTTELYYRNTVTASPERTSRRDFNLRPDDITLGIAVEDQRLTITCFVHLLRIADLSLLTKNDYSAFSKAFGYFRIDPCTLIMTAAASKAYAITARSELQTDLEKQIAEAEKDLADANAFLQSMKDFVNTTPYSEADKKALLDDCQRSVDNLTDKIEKLKVSPSQVILDSANVMSDVTVSALRVSDWTWSWTGQQLRPVPVGPNPPALVVQDGTTHVALLKAGITSDAAVLRESALTPPQGDVQTEIGYPSAEDRPLVLMSVYGPLRGSAFLFERKGKPTAKGKAPPYRATNLFHHGICAFLTNVRQDGIDALLGNRALQVSIHDPIGDAHAKGQNLAERDTALVDFTDGGLYSVFNWELFFHAPLLIATRLSANRRYEAAQAWFHRIFDPTQGRGEPGTAWAEPPSSFWKVRPFFENKDLGSIQEELAQLDSGATNESKALGGLDDALGTSTSVQKLLDQIEAWRANPFKPHAIARLRPVAYQKTVVVKYIENLIAWGDDLFRRDTIETITEATQLYILGRQLLGARPRTLAAPPPATATMAGALRQNDAFSAAVVETESLMPAPAGGGCCGEPLPSFFTDYFCVVGNDKTTELWDTIADRLFKIRNSMDIEGVVRELALFEPPIDPALLVLAAAAGVDLQSVLADASVGTLPYRFQVVHGRAMELASGVSALGQALLQALEKRDGETITRLRQTQEIEVLRATREAKVLEVKEASEAALAAEAGQATIQKRLSHYEALLSAGVSEEEQASIDHTHKAAIASTIGAGFLALAGTLVPIPQVEVGVAGLGPYQATRVVAGTVLAAELNFAASVANIGGILERSMAESASTAASHQRRSEDWSFQIQLAKAELKQSAKQVAAAKIRQAIAESALATLDLQRDNARAVDDFLRDKLTNEDLYDWMSDKLMDLYYAAYKLAYDMAKRAEKAYQTELSIEGAPKYITFGYWDSAKRGLLSGEQLLHGLRALEVAYHEQNKRELEITKHVSLATSFPVELLKLREMGACSVDIPEKLFDWDFPSHYLRRLRHVSLSAHGVAGPYTSVNCTLRLTESHVRRKAAPGDLNPVTPETQAIVTSSGQADGGLFETNLRDERYLPFEGAGAISKWSVSLPPKTNAFDLRTVSDVVLHLQYTARDGGAAFGDAVTGATAFTDRDDLRRLIDVRADLAEVWASFQTLATADVPLRYADFRYLAGDPDIIVKEIAVYARRSGADVSVTFIHLTVPSVSPEIAATPSWSPDADTNLHLATWPTSDPPETKTIKKSGTSDIEALRIAIASVEDAAQVQDLYIVITYKQTIA